MSKSRKRAPTHGAVAHTSATGWLPYAVVLFIVTCIVYLPALSGGFVWDEDVKVVQHAAWSTLFGLRAIWLEITVAGPQYYPLTQTSFWLEHQAWGLWPVGYHLTNIVLHTANACLLGMVLQRLAVPGAWVAAFLFALHPVQVESVAWVSERKNVLSMFFALWALLVYWRFAQQEKRKDYVAALLLYVCGLLSKTLICSLPAVILLIQWWKNGRIAWREIRPLIPFFVLGVLASGITVALEDKVRAVEHLFFLERVLIAGRALVFYVGKLLWPHPLIFIYPRWEIDPGVWWQWLFPVGVLLLTGLLYVRRHRIGRGPLVAWLIFAGVLAPVLGFFNVYFHRLSFVADHFQYHASATLIALAAALMWRGAPTYTSSPSRACCSIVLLLTLGSLTWTRVPVYHDVGTLWSDTVRQNPSSGVAHDNLGVHLLKQKDLQGALLHFQARVRLDPWSARAYFYLAYTLALQGKRDDAIHAGRESVRLAPDVPDAYLLLARIYRSKGDTEPAEYYVNEARKRWPRGLAANARGGQGKQ